MGFIQDLLLVLDKKNINNDISTKKDREKQLKKELQELLILEKEIHKTEKDIVNKKEFIYNTVRQQKVKDGTLIAYRGIEINPFIESPGFSNLFGYLSKAKFFSYRILLEYYDDTNEKRFLGINETEPRMIELFKKENYIVSDSKTAFFYKGKRILSATPKAPITLNLDVDGQKFFADAPTLHKLVNYVFDYRLTIPIGGGFSISDFLKKNWLLILFGIIAYILYKQGVFN